MNASAPRLAIALGNDFRRDKCAGWIAARMIASMPMKGVRVIEASGESGEAHGCVARIKKCLGDRRGSFWCRAGHDPPPGCAVRAAAGEFFHYSTHAFSLAEAVELARILGQLPEHLIVYGIEGKEFTSGEGLSPEVAAAVEEVVRRVKAELSTKCP